MLQKNKIKENKDVKDGIENTNSDIPCDVDDENNAENEVEVAEDFVNFPELVQSWSRESSRRRDGSGKIFSVLCRNRCI